MSQKRTASSKGTIFVVDDTPANLNLLTEILSLAGYKVRLAPSGKLALRSIFTISPDLILLDIVMPEMDGYQVCKELKASSQTQNIPIIFISALYEVFDKVKAFSLGAVDYITKPFEVQEVLARVEHQLRISRLTQQLAQQNTQLQKESEERQQAEKALSESEQRFRSAFDHAANGMALVGIDDRWLKVNPALCKILGYSEPELLATPYSAITYPEEVQQYLSGTNQLLADKTSSCQLEVRYCHKDGHAVWVLVSISLVRDSLGKPLYFVTQIQDITERRAIEKIKNEFISVVSHELRTPLTSIRGSLGLLTTGVFNSQPQRMQRMIEIAASETERLVRLVNDILDLERLESGKVTLVKKCTDAANLMVQSVDVMRSLAQQENILLSVSPVSVQVLASPDHIIQTLTNLLSNAIKFSPPHTTVTLSAQSQNDYVLFQIKDQGKGIPADKLEVIFDRFHQIDASDSRQKGGTGLGLAICRSIITQHGGKIWVESIFGEGSTFFFTLPSPAFQT